MNSRKSILQCGIILYICVFLTGVPFVVSSFAKITKKPVEEKLQVITIKKGDTLWDLAEKWLNDPIKWPEFKKYNEYTNPNLIYPGEEMQIPVGMAEEMVKEGDKEITVRSSEIGVAMKELQNSNQEISKKLQSQMEELEELKNAVNRLRRNINQKAGKKQVEKIDEKLSNAADAVERELQKSTKQVNQLNEKVDKIDQNVKAIGEKVEQLATGRQQQVTKINQSIETLTTKTNQNQESISKLEKKVAESEGKVEKPSQGKKAFVVLTALAGGIAWFVVSSLSHSD